MENSISKNKNINSTNDNENSIVNNNIYSKNNSKIKFLKNQEEKNGNKKDDDNEVGIAVKTLKRSNSIKLYKKQAREKERRESLKKESDKQILQDISNIERVKKTNKPAKKVAFSPDLVEIIDVESYKKFNEENTCKDPFDNMEFINGTISVNHNDDEEDGKAKVLCSCSIY